MPLQKPPMTELEKVFKTWKGYNQAAQIWAIPQYFAPTFFRPAGSSLPRLNYYKTKTEALRQLLYMVGEPGYKDQKSAGSVELKKDGTAQTIGINAEFFFPAKYFIDIPIPYNILKDVLTKKLYRQFIVSFQTPQGKGPYYGVFDYALFGISATKETIHPNKLAAAKEFYANLALLKARYNTLVITLNKLIEMPRTEARQKQIDRLTQYRITALSQIQKIDGINIIDNSSGELSGTGIGVVWVPIIIALILVGGAAYTLDKWISENAKVKKVVAGLDQEKWAIAEKEKIAEMKQKKLISDEDADDLTDDLDGIIDGAKKMVDKNSTPAKSMFGEMGDIVKWGALGLVGFALINTLGKSKN